jgi:hypothetical protein
LKKQLRDATAKEYTLVIERCKDWLRKNGR